MKVNYSFLRILFALVIGLLLVIFPDDAGNYFVMIIGTLFVIPSLISLAAYFSARSKGIRLPIEGIGSLLFGLWLIISPAFFATLLTYILGFILLMGGVQQLSSLLLARQWVRVSPYYYVLPSLILIAGLVALFNPGGIQRTAFLIIGCSSLVYALQELISWFSLMRRRPRPEVEQQAQQPAAEGGSGDDDIEDAEIIEISSEK